MKINVIGGGTWGVTLTSLLCEKADITVWQRSSRKTEQISKNRYHPNLSNYNIPTNVSFTSDLKLLDFNNLNILAIPSHVFKDILLNCNLSKGKYLIASRVLTMIQLYYYHKH